MDAPQLSKPKTTAELLHLRASRYNSPMQTPSPKDILSVAQLNRLAKQLLEDCFSQVNVVGELSNLARPSSGHWYFTLKDERAQIRCAMFKGRNFAVRFQPEAGQQVQISGKVSLYEGRGDYQMIVESMQPAGAGALAMAFEQLKRELQAAGWFDRKRPLPKPIRHIAIVTSPTGAAIRDLLSVFGRRWPAIRLTLLPSQVQGDAAAAQLVSALKRANSLDGDMKPDVILLTRGGGSLEDLWPFNERAVAEAIFNSALPVVSAVGHEVDFSISDFVADLRAATPSAAAELLCPDQTEVLAYLVGLHSALQAQIKRDLQQCQTRRLALHKRLRNPGQLLAERAQRADERELHLQRLMHLQLERGTRKLESLQLRLQAASPLRRLAEQRRQLSDVHKRLPQLIQRALREKRRQAQFVTELMIRLSPDNVLQRGFSIVLDSQGRAVKNSEDIKIGEVLQARFAKGAARVAVKEKM